MSSQRTHSARWLLLAAALAIGLSPLPAAAAGEPATKPNIVLILTDDENVASHEFMPKTKALLENRGAVFDNFFVTYSFCCPSRVTHAARSVPAQHADPRDPAADRRLRQGRATSACRSPRSPPGSDAAGYHTAYLGKYLNQYVPEEHGVPPGWDDWHVGSDNNSNYNYTLNENGMIVAYGERPEDYLTDVMAASRSRSSSARQPPATRCSSTSRPMRRTARRPGRRATTACSRMCRCRARPRSTSPT